MSVLLCLSVCLLTTYVSGTCRGRKRTLSPLEQELWAFHVDAGLEPGSPGEAVSARGALFCFVVVFFCFIFFFIIYLLDILVTASPLSVLPLTSHLPLRLFSSHGYQPALAMPSWNRTSTSSVTARQVSHVEKSIQRQAIESDSPCSCYYKSHMETQLHICYICTESLGLSHDVLWQSALITPVALLSKVAGQHLSLWMSLI